MSRAQLKISVGGWVEDTTLQPARWQAGQLFFTAVRPSKFANPILSESG